MAKSIALRHLRPSTKPGAAVDDRDMLAARTQPPCRSQPPEPAAYYYCGRRRPRPVNRVALVISIQFMSDVLGKIRQDRPRPVG